MKNTFIFAFSFLLYLSPGGTYETYCSSGERLHTPRVGHDVCIPCTHGTFIAEDNHFFRKCKPCTEIEIPDVEVLISTCNITHDAVVHCTGGFYRRRARNIRQKDKCEKCTECPFRARRCEGYYNTVCCPPNHHAIMTPDGVFVCNERPIVCRAGQFFSTSREECLPCPAWTFISDHSHTYKDCFKCEELTENNLTQAVIIRPCSRTAPTLFGCKAGYFRDPTQESLQIEVPCTPCRICNHPLVDCGMFQDVVCDNGDRKGLHEDTEIRARGTSVPTDVLHSHERNEGNRSQNGVTERQTIVPSDVSAYVVLFATLMAILISAFVAVVRTYKPDTEHSPNSICTDKPDTEHSPSSVRTDNPDTEHSPSSDACSRIKTPSMVIATVLFVLLLALLIICALLTTGTNGVRHDASTACVIITVLAAGGYVITVISLIRRPHKPQGNEDKGSQKSQKSQVNEGRESRKSQVKKDRGSRKSDRGSQKSQVKEDRGSYKSLVKEDRRSLKSQAKEDRGSQKSLVKEDRRLLKSQVKEDRGSQKSLVKEDRGSQKSLVKEDRGLQKSLVKEDRGSQKSLVKEDRGSQKSLVKEDRGSQKSLVKEDRGSQKSQVNEDRGLLKSQAKEDRGSQKSPVKEDRGSLKLQVNQGRRPQ